MTWSDADHARCDALLARQRHTRHEQQRRKRPRACRKLTEAERKAVDAIVARMWADAPSVDAIAAVAGHSPPYISKRAREMGLPPRRKDRRRA